MSIDWVTVLAQLANFLLLVWLLKRFLFQPILKGIDAREAEIARRMDAADQARAQALAAEQRYLQQHQHSVSEQEARVAQALQASQQERDQLIADTRAQLEQEQQDWHRHLQQERKEFLLHLRQSSTLTILALVRKVLHELADETLEAAILRHAGRQLAPLAPELASAVGQTKEAVVSTRHTLDQALQVQLQAEFADLLPGVLLRFEVDEQQAPGLVIEAGGARVAWTIDSYLDELENALAQAPSNGASAGLTIHEL